MLIFTVSKTYEVVTEESSMHGDAEERGFEYEDKQLSFSELMTELSSCTKLSDYPTVNERTWATSSEDMDMYTGSHTSTSIHISKVNGHPLTLHQIKRIYKAAGLLK